MTTVTNQSRQPSRRGKKKKNLKERRAMEPSVAAEPARPGARIALWLAENSAGSVPASVIGEEKGASEGSLASQMASFFTKADRRRKRGGGFYKVSSHWPEALALEGGGTEQREGGRNS